MTTTGGAATVGGGDHEVGPAAEGLEPGQPGCRRATSGAHPGCATAPPPRRDPGMGHEANEVSTTPATRRRLATDARTGDQHFRPNRARSARLPGLCRRPESLRIAWLIYRGNPHCGGQGVYTRYLAREVTELGHHVEVLSGQPYPELDDPSQLVKIPSLDLYRPGNPFRVPWPWEFQDRDRPPRVRHHVRGGLPRAVHVQPAGRADLLAGPPRRLRPHPRQPVPRHRAARDDGRRLADLCHPPPPDHRRPRPRPRARHERVAAVHPAALVRVPRDADEGRARSPARSSP